MSERTQMILITIITACILVAIIPVSAVKTAEQSAGDSLTRGSRFTVTITGLPNSSYYIWLTHTATMSGEPRDQPPVIIDNQVNVNEDPADGPWPIGSYQYNNGGGQTIRDDIAPSTQDMPNTRYYALVTTDNRGLATVEFLTSVNTGLRSYSVKVENPASADSDNLQIDLRVYSRRALTVTEIVTTMQTPTTTFPQITPETPMTVTTFSATTTPAPVQTTRSTQTPAQKAPVDIVTCGFIAGLSLFLAKRRRFFGD